MNNEKLIDAIGMIDDNFIVAAKKSKSHSSLYTSIIAAILVISLIPVGMFGGMMLFGSLRANTADPRFQYSFKDEEMKALSKQSLSVENNPSAIFDPDAMGGTIGTVPVEIHYADNNRIIFTTYNGVFVHYRSAHNYIESSYSVEKMELPGFNQGDITTQIEVDKSGEYALLISSENMSQAGADISYHILNFSTGKLTEIDKTQTPETFEAFELTKNSYIKNYDDILSSNMASYIDENGNKTDCYISVSRDEEKGYIIGNAELIESKENENVKKYNLFK